MNMTTRRDFLRLSAAAAAAGCTLRASSLSAAGFAGTHDRIAYGVQLYMVAPLVTPSKGIWRRSRQEGVTP